MKRSDKVFGIVIAAIVLVTLSLNIISKMDPSKRQVNPIDEDDPFDTTELSKSYIYDHSQIKNP
jgi:hypothetical protein